MVTLFIVVTLVSQTGSFEKLGTPVVKAGLMGTLVGPGSEDNSERIYFNFRQDGGKLFLVAVDPATDVGPNSDSDHPEVRIGVRTYIDKAEQFQSPAGTGAWGFIVGPDNKIYLGTHEGPDPDDSGQILVFDPKHPEKQIQVVGPPSPTETYLWMFTVGLDGKIYGCTYPSAKLVSYDPQTGAQADLGVMDETQKYTRSICTGPDGRIYLGVGFGKANVVVYDPKTGQHKAILPDEYRQDLAQTVATVYRGTDGKVYVSALKMVKAENEPAAKPKSVVLVANGDTLEEAASPAAEASKTKFKDGRVVSKSDLSGNYEITKPDGSVEKHKFSYQGAGAGIFMTATGPLGRIYGGTAMPCEMFWYDPAKNVSENPGNPCEVGGEIYSMLDHHGTLYICAYPGSFLSKWDPAKPWNYGRGPENNPRGFGPLGPGHLRPRAMIHGPEDMIYIGSYPEYGLHGGSLGIWDPAQDKLIENYHHLIKNQAIISLVYDPKTELVFGGSSTAGGGGTDPVEKEAKFFAFDAKKKGLVLEEAPEPGAQGIRAMALVGRKVFGVAGAQLFVYDIDGKQFVHKARLPGTVQDCSLGAWKDGKLYGLTKNEVFRLDPETYQVDVLATYDHEIHCGFAMDDQGIYFGDRATLMRYNWQR